jgi:hypothetical protein
MKYLASELISPNKTDSLDTERWIVVRILLETANISSHFLKMNFKIIYYSYYVTGIINKAIHYVVFCVLLSLPPSEAKHSPQHFDL